MHKLIAVTLLTLSALTVRAEVVIYKVWATNAYTGGGRGFTQVVSGRLVWDHDGSETPMLLTWAKIGTKYYYQVDCPALDFKYVRGRNGIESLGMFITAKTVKDGENVGITQGYFRGTNSVVAISEFPAANISLRTPKSIKGVWREALQDQDGFDYLSEATVYGQFLGLQTREANFFHRSVSQQIEFWVDQFELNGWTEDTPEVPCF